MNYPNWAKYKTWDLDGSVNVHEYQPILNDDGEKWSSEGVYKYLGKDYLGETKAIRLTKHNFGDTYGLSDERVMTIVSVDKYNVFDGYPILGLITQYNHKDELEYYTEELKPLDDYNIVIKKRGI